MDDNINVRLETLGNFIAEQLSPTVFSEIIRESIMNEINSYLQNFLKIEIENLVVRTVKKEVDNIKQQFNNALEQISIKLQESLSALNNFHGISNHLPPKLSEPQSPLINSNISQLPLKLSEPQSPFIIPNSSQLPLKLSDPQSSFVKPNIQNFLISSKAEELTPQGFCNPLIKNNERQNSEETMKAYFQSQKYSEGFQIFLTIQDDRLKENFLNQINLDLINEQNLDRVTSDALAQWALINSKPELLSKLISITHEKELLSKYLRKIVALKNPLFNDIKSILLKKNSNG